MLRGQLLAGSTTRYGEGVISNPGICGHSGTINGFNTDMYYFEKPDASVVISVNRLDKDNEPQTTPVLQAVFKTIQSELLAGHQ
jgi:D-alanyl-D-alanine carboxypeptidase